MILQNDYMLSTRRALAFHWWILDLQAIGPFFSHVILIIFRSGAFQTVYRYNKLRLNKRTARWMTTFQSSELSRIPSLLKKRHFSKSLVLNSGSFIIIKRIIDTLFFSVYKFPDQISFFFLLKIIFQRNLLPCRQWHPTPVLLPGKSHGWRRLVGCSPWGH